MDENYLDGLLESLDSADGELNDNLDLDSGVDIDLSDMDGISLTELDDLDSMDLGDLDFDDIDFDDIDITNLEVGEEPIVRHHEKKKEDMNLDSLIAEAEEQQVVTTEIADDTKSEEVFEEAEQQMQEDTALSALFDDQTFDKITGDDSGRKPEKSPEPILEGAKERKTEPTREASQEMDELDSLLGSILDLNEHEDGNSSSYTKDEDNLDALLQSSMEFSMESGDLEDIEGIGETGSSKVGRKKPPKGQKKRRSLSEIIFGEPDEDDIEEDAYLAEQKEKKAIEKEKKKAAREVAKAEKNEARQEKLAIKAKEDGKKQKAKAEKKAARDAEYAEELEKEKNAKKVPTAVVVIVFALFAALGAFVVLGSKGFSYSQVIKKATDYFERQRYRLAYDEVSGVEVKKKDQELKDRIYTVMYVERLYESYENNMSLKRPDKALDALLRGIEKYDEHYDEAVELDIVEDIDSCREKIIYALWNDYGITEETAYSILELKDQEYTQTLMEISGIDAGE